MHRCGIKTCNLGTAKHEGGATRARPTLVLMASLTVYSNEPATKGKVVLYTSIGPLDVELWSKEAPLACRNFVQLCLENYYDGCIFHRVIKDFMAQTGDPTGTGTGGDSIYDGNFKDEVHGRLRFTHRGLLAMASNGPDTNSSQFFITLAECPWLDRKHTIFGKVTGNSMYNLPRLNELECDDSDRPLYPPRIERTEVLLEPFDDIVPRAPKPAAAEEEPSKKRRKKEKKNLNLLSFGEEAADDEQQAAAMGGEGKGKSSHDVLDDPRLSKQRALEGELQSNGQSRTQQEAAGRRAAAQAAVASAASRARGDGGGGGGGDEDGSAFESSMLQRMQQKRDRLRASAAEAQGAGGGDAAAAEEGGGDESGGSSGAKRGEGGRGEYERLRGELAAEMKAEKADADKPGEPSGRGWKWRGKGQGGEDDDDDDDDDDDEEAGMSALEKQRAKYMKRKQESAGLSKKQRQIATMHKLQQFQKGLSSKPAAADDGGAVADGEEAAGGWLSHTLKFGDEKREAESAKFYDCYDPLAHGEDSSRALSKIREREKTMLSLKAGTYADDEEDGPGGGLRD